MTNDNQKSSSFQERAKELARKHRREQYQRQKEYRKKLREAEKAQKAEEKRLEREKKDAELWGLIKSSDETPADD